MSVQIGDRIPSVSLRVMGPEGPEPVTTDELFAGKRVVMFAVPGAFTPGCSRTHLPGFVVQADAIRAKGVDSIICTSVNDAFVMAAWGQAQNAEAIIMLADGNAELASALGLTKDASAFQMGTRSQRYAMIVNDGVIELLNVDEKGIDLSSAETILNAL
ncbi:peroxiredoxin [Aestuariirhabdus litorea]|uniref:Glutathione-dependent peroxiredoxin n=1 Tax=Aestuariirhabdus litorea TaxID=2528527 RepID=A0A3P3VQE9_9GAMM|nr:peroxiredoxin [Aestuariirhabdus litorea]RRJ83043.1 peroxiredoxin [Aestuariirhabdus litorea]RWW93201.1 redoxin domain-containing protein [Endozoicomonadaceae bacterium GTF-13]